MTRPANEHDEFLLSQLLDGDLPDDRAAELRARMDCESDLRAAFEALSRIDRCLKVRRSDRPAVNWERFHASVVNAVTRENEPPGQVSERQGTVIRFPAWFRVAMPLAAAAAVAFMVTLWRSPETIVPEGEPASQLQVAYVTPQPEPAGILMVQINRPKLAAPSPKPVISGIQVAFAKSSDLDNATRQSDEDRQSRPTWQLYSARHINADVALLSEMADAPL